MSICTPAQHRARDLGLAMLLGSRRDDAVLAQRLRTALAAEARARRAA